MRGKAFTTVMTIALALVMVLGVLAPVSRSADDMGTSPEPRAIFQIFDVNDLQDMQNHLTDDCILMNDIDASATSSWNWNVDHFEGFMPVGNFTTQFTGSLDGQNHTIIELYINRSVDYVGLFGYMDAGSSAMGLSLSGNEINGAMFVGSFAGWNAGTITSCYSTGNASGGDAVGGFAGWNAGTITNCYSTGNSSGTGLLAVGGFAGFNDVIGTITNCYSTGNASGIWDVGGFAGSNSGTITNCYSIGNATGAVDVGGFAGYNDGGSITDCFWDTEISGRSTSDGGTGKTTAEMMQQATFTNWDFNVIGDGTIGNWIMAGYPHLQFEQSIEITNIVELQLMAVNLTAHYILMNDIDATITSTWNGGEGFVPVGDWVTKFTGSLDGQNHTIIGLYINRTTNYAGLFGFMGAGSSAMDLSLSGFEISGCDYVGGFAGRNWGGPITNCYSTGNTSGDLYVGSFAGANYGTITNCSSTGNASGDDYVGGFAGLINSGTITNCSSTGSASGDDYVGGFAGDNSGTITNCSSTGTASGTWCYAGGFAGWNNGTITNCSSTGNTPGALYVGGFAGGNDGTITNCYSTGNTSGAGDTVGGFVGGNWATITNCYSTGNASGDLVVGGFAGENWATITNCHSTGNASGTVGYAGGFAGWNNGGITNCYSTGNANGILYVGGFAGVNDGGSITNCYSTGTASGDDDVGGFLGYNNSGIIADCFWDIETSGQATSAGGTGKTTAEMMQQTTFTNWDFTTIWGIIEHYTYPYFQPLDLNFRLSVKLPLSEGWNLLSLPVTQSSENLDDILENIDGKWDCIQTYDPLSPELWKTNNTLRPDQLNDFSTLNHKQGFWINITEPNVNLTVSGYIPPSTSINLYAGWNLVGYPTLTEKTIADALWGTGADRVEVFDPGEPYRIKEVGPTYLMKPGEGYWVHVPFDTVWVVDW